LAQANFLAKSVSQTLHLAFVLQLDPLQGAMLKSAPLVFLLISTAAAGQEVVLTKPASPKSALCSPCVQLGGQGINILVNAILNAGVMGGCSKLCAHLKTAGSQKVCDLACDVVGFKAFVKALNHTDLDPIYFCELIHACKAGADDAHVDLLSVKLNPATLSSKDIQSGGSGVTIEGVVTVNVTKETGVGQWTVDVHGPVEGSQGPIGGSFILADGLKEGVQSLGVKLNIQNTDGDPTAQPPSFPVVWNPGSYMFRAHMCQGECGSKHPHSIDFGLKSGNFTISSESQGVLV